MGLSARWSLLCLYCVFLKNVTWVKLLPQVIHLCDSSLQWVHVGFWPWTTGTELYRIYFARTRLLAPMWSSIIPKWDTSLWLLSCGCSYVFSMLYHQSIFSHVWKNTSYKKVYTPQPPVSRRSHKGPATHLCGFSCASPMLKGQRISSHMSCKQMASHLCGLFLCGATIQYYFGNLSHMTCKNMASLLCGFLCGPTIQCYICNFSHKFRKYTASRLCGSSYAF